MIEPWAAASADGAPDRFCERCGSPARPAGALQRVGLTTCRACGIHACQRCWARSVGACPACGVATATTSVLRTVRGTDRAATVPPASLAARPAPTRRPRAAAVAALAILLAVGATAFALIPRLAAPLAGEVAGIAGMPAASADGAAGSGAALTTPAAPAETAGRSTADPGRGQIAGGASDEDPIPTAPGAPAPTRAPTPQPTPVRTPAPAPTPRPCLLVAPRLIGQLRSDAQRIWAGAGFTGRVTALAGHGNYVIGSQSRTAGREYPCDSDLTVGPA